MARRLDQFWAMLLELGDEDGPCVEWPGYRNKKGYGERKRNGEGQATRALWVELHGPIAEGMLVLHRCDNPPCVRPAHLRLGSSAENTADMVSKGRSTARFTPEQVIEIRTRRAAGEKYITLAREFGVSYQAISYACTGRNYAHVDGKAA